MNSSIFKRCCFCGERFPPVDLEHHQHHCPSNLHECSNCRRMVPYAQLSDHLQECISGNRENQQPRGELCRKPAQQKDVGGGSSVLGAMMQKAMASNGLRTGSEAVSSAPPPTTPQLNDSAFCARCGKTTSASHECEKAHDICLHCGEQVDVRLAEYHHVRCIRKHTDTRRHGESSASATRSQRQPDFVPPPQISSFRRSDGSTQYSKNLEDLMATYLPPQRDAEVPSLVSPNPSQYDGSHNAELVHIEEPDDPKFRDIPQEQRSTMRRCPLCDDVVTISMFFDHLDICPENVRSCEFCGVGVPQWQYERHVESCPRNRRTCYICQKTFQVADLPAHLSECGANGRVITMFHGTTLEKARLILRYGFEPSTKGLLGAGVYMSRDVKKAEHYGDVIVEARVDIGRVALINKKGHFMQKNWAAHGFDSAWIPAQSRVGVSELEEHCVADPQRIAPVRITSAHTT